MAANWKPPSVDASGFQPHDSRITVMISAQDEDDQGVKRFHAGSYIEVEAKEDFADVFDVVAVEEILPMSGDADSPEMPSATSMSIYYLEPSTTYQIRARFRKDPNAYTAYSPVVKARTCAGPMPRQPAADDVEYAEAKEQEMRDYLADIRAMVERLQQHPNIVVTRYHEYPPITDDKLADLENTIGFSLDTAIKAFYKQSNGLQLNWICKTKPKFDAAIHVPAQPPREWWYGDDSVEDGSICMPPLEDVLTHDWEGQTYFDFMKEQSHTFRDVELNSYDFMKSVKGFDIYVGSGYYAMAFILYPKEQNVPVMLGSNYQADYTSSYRTDFHSYMQFLIASYGLCTRRNFFYQQWFGDSLKYPTLLTPKGFWHHKMVLDLDQYINEGQDSTRFAQLVEVAN
eukprot:TRINITY_DN7841_c0_g1_i4.p1 TRINITY_DN7841_c0_g1~~TRINITY_DN7841_c0_g1_i4.p1  ORF type:complete len:407 (+),score=61.10 TRINITY_DN7841_c0_g1_i4:22-1221(+)